MLLGNMSPVLINAFSARIRTFMIINTVLTVLIISYFSLIWFMGLILKDLNSTILFKLSSKKYI